MSEELRKIMKNPDYQILMEYVEAILYVNANRDTRFIPNSCMKYRCRELEKKGIVDIYGWGPMYNLTNKGKHLAHELELDVKMDNTRKNWMLSFLDEAKKLGIDFKKYRMHFEKKLGAIYGNAPSIDVYLIPNSDDEEAVIITYDTYFGEISHIKGTYKPKVLTPISVIAELKGFKNAEKNAVSQQGSPEDYNNPDIDENYKQIMGLEPIETEEPEPEIDEGYNQIMNHEPIEKKLPCPKVEDLQPDFLERKIFEGFVTTPKIRHHQ